MSIVRNEVKENFTIVANEVLRSKSISWRAKGIYAYLCGCTDGFNVTVETIATFGNCGRVAASKGIIELKNHGLLVVEQQNDGKFGNNVWIIKNKIMIVESVSGKPVSRKPADGESTTNNTKLDNKTIENNICSPKASETDSEFDAWWQIYPRKVAKGTAYNAYKKARKTVSAETLAVATRKLLSKIRAGTIEIKYTPHPATWLNAQRWLDEDESKSFQNEKVGVYA